MYIKIAVTSLNAASGHKPLFNAINRAEQTTGVLNRMEQEYSKHDIALHFLEKSLTLFLEDKDYLSTLVIAGVAEELLGKVLDANNAKNSLRRRIEGTRPFYRYLYGEDPKDRAISNTANYAKNLVKHLNGPSDAIIRMDFAEEAFEMLERATDNYFLLNQVYTPNMEKFRKEHKHAPREIDLPE